MSWPWPRRGSGPIRWAIDGKLPEGLTFDPSSGAASRVPRAGTAEPTSLVLRASDGTDRTSQVTRLVVYESDRPMTMPSKWAPHLPPIPWRAWPRTGVGFLILWLVYLVGMNTLASLQRRSMAAQSADDLRTECSPSVHLLSLDGPTGLDRRGGHPGRGSSSNAPEPPRKGGNVAGRGPVRGPVQAGVFPLPEVFMYPPG